ncbi:hypothetical protein QBZ16_000333 [Prototheca wickerhamii]|uniref:Uncharacterized protein n=1 Tax=Prototheca wickerhamii TaxID=3111 RepID=A0AAD9INY1_PROWI|nr:hypothetical protein QBZ16_000333 [Prototheca wickerhamii]
MSQAHFNNSHGALGDRARKIDQGILVIRFEMPFNVWCTGCCHLIGKGVRFNAEKKQIGMYHSTRIWSFCMRAPCCQQKIEIHTDPKNAEYRIVTGLRRKRESFNAEDAGTVELASAAERESRRDPLSSLDRDLEDRTRAAEANRAVATLQRESTARYRDDYDMNRKLRRAMRGVRRDEKTRDVRRAALGLPSSVRLAPENEADRLRAAAVDFGAGTSGPSGERGYQRSWKEAKRRIKTADVAPISPFSAAM